MTDCKYPREAALIPHYEAHPQYYSPVPQIMPALIEAFRLDTGTLQIVLDLGSGDGRLSLWLARHYQAVVTGVDYSPTRVALATEAASVSGLSCSFVCQDLHYYLQNCDTTYDLVPAFEVLEHLEAPLTVVRRCLELLTENGCVIGSVPKNMPYAAHLQVFRDVDDVYQRLAPARIVQDRNHWYCQWFRP